MSVPEKYLQFVAENHVQGSGTASSYVTAINKLENALHKARKLPLSHSLWHIHDINYLATLYEFVKQEQKKEDGGIFRHETAKSYWQKGFCSAAVKQLSQFVSLYGREKTMLDIIDAATDGVLLGKALESTPLPPNPLLIDDEMDVSTLEGRTVLREIEVRQNQHVFRKMILINYDKRCCLTGLPIPEVLRASHISEWAKDKDNRMNPENGLCLAATYDAAFDRHLISFDENYCLILAPSLHDYCTNKAFQEHFKRFEGARISMPKRFFPSQALLEKHRNAMQ